MKYVKLRSIFFHLSFLLLAILAVFLYEERLYADSGYYIMQVINHRFFHVEHGRIVLVLSQIFPLLAIYAGSGLKTVLLIYSLGHVLFFYLLFLILHYRLQDEPASLAIILLQFAGTAQSFFSPQFEMYYAIGLLILFISMIRTCRLSFVNSLFLILLEILILSGHPMCFYLFLFTMIQLYIDKRLQEKKYYLVFLCIFLIGILIKFLTFSEYEESKISFHLNFQINTQYLQLLEASYLKKLAIYLLMNYLDVLFLFVLLSVFYLQSKQYVRWLNTFLFSAGYICFMNAMYPAIDSGRYFEQVYFPFVAIIVISFTYDYYRNLEFKWIGRLFIAGVIIYRSFLILEASVPFQQRIIQMKGLIVRCQEEKIQRVVFNEATLRQPYSNFGWSYPIESLLLSSQERNGISVTLISLEDYRSTVKKDILEVSEYIFRLQEIKPVTYLNYRYFDLGQQGYFFNLIK